MNVHLDRVTVRLGDSTLVDDVALDVPAGSTLGVVGPNGSGKSTLLRTLYREVAPTLGAVLVDGHDVRRAALREHARTVAALAQDGSPELDFTVREVVALGRHPHPHDPVVDATVVEDALARTELTHLVDRSVLSLSGGERQRVMIARALAQATPVLVLDEPTNHLDLRHQHRVVARLARSDRTVLIALHDLNLAAAVCDTVAVLRAGHVVAHGPPQDVLTPDLVEAVYGLRPHLVRHPDGGHPQLLFTPDLNHSPEETHTHVHPTVPS